MKREIEKPAKGFEDSLMYEVESLEADSPEPQKKMTKHAEFNPTGAILHDGTPIQVDNPVGYQEVNHIKEQRNIKISFNVNQEGVKPKKKMLPYEECFQAISDLANYKNIYSFVLLKEKFLVNYVDVFTISPRKARENDLWSSTDNWIYTHASIDLTGFQFLCCQNPIDVKNVLEELEKLFKLILDKIPFETLVESSAVYPENFQPIFVNILFARALNNNDHELCAKLLRLKADINSVEYLKGYTPLATAVRIKSLTLVKLLIDNYAPINKVDQFGKSALVYAAQNIVDLKDQLNLEIIDIFDFLLNAGANPEITFIDTVLGKTTLLAYLVNHDCYVGVEIILRHLKRLKLSVDPIDSDNSTPLHAAVSRRNIRTVGLLIGSGANVEALTSNGLNSLQIAAIGLAEQSDQNVTIDFQVFELLLTHTTDPNRKFSQQHGMAEKGWTILHLLVVKNVGSMITLLLKCLVKKRLSVDIEDESGNTPLSYAFLCQNDELVRLIMGAGGNIKHESISSSAGSGSVISKLKLSKEEIQKTLHYEQLSGEQAASALNKSMLLEERCNLQALEIQTLKTQIAELQTQLKNIASSPKRDVHSDAEIMSTLRKRGRRHSDSDMTLTGDSAVCKKINFDTP